MKRITEIGEVIEEEPGGKMVVKLNSEQANCSSCPLQGKCGSGKNIPQLEIDNNRGFKIGDRVLITMPYFPQSLFNLLLFGIPVLILVILFILFTNLRVNENIAFFLALGGGVISFGLVLAGLKKFEKIWVDKIEVKKLNEKNDGHG